MHAVIPTDFFGCKNFQQLDDRVNRLKNSGMIILVISAIALALIAIVSRKWSQLNYLKMKNHLFIVYGTSGSLGGILSFLSLLKQKSLRKKFIEKRLDWQKKKAEEVRAKIEQPKICEGVLSSCMALRTWTNSSQENIQHLKNLVNFLRCVLTPKQIKQVESSIDKLTDVSVPKDPSIHLKEPLEKLIAQHESLFQWIKANRSLIHGMLDSLCSSDLPQELVKEIKEKIALYISKVEEAKALFEKYENILNQIKNILLCLIQYEDKKLASHYTSSIERLFTFLRKDLFYAFVTDHELWSQKEGVKSLQSVLEIPLKGMLLAINGQTPQKALAANGSLQGIKKELEEKYQSFSLIQKKIQPGNASKLLNVTLSGAVGCATIFGIDVTKVASEQIENGWNNLFEEYPFLKCFLAKTQVKNECDEIMRHMIFYFFLHPHNRVAYRNKIQSALHKALEETDQRIAKELGEKKPEIEPKNAAQNTLKSTDFFYNEIAFFFENFTNKVKEFQPQKAEPPIFSSNILLHSPGFASFKVVDKKLQSFQQITIVLLFVSSLTFLTLHYFLKNPQQVWKFKAKKACIAIGFSSIYVFIVSLIRQNQLYKGYIDFYMKKFNGTASAKGAPLQANAPEPKKYENYDLSTFLKEQVKKCMELESFLEKNKGELAPIKIQIGEQRVNKYVTFFKNFMTKQHEIAWIHQHQETLEDFSEEILGVEEAKRFQAIIRSIYSSFSMIVQALAHPVKVPLHPEQKGDQIDNAQNIIALPQNPRPLSESVTFRFSQYSAFLSWFQKSRKEFETLGTIFAGEEAKKLLGKAAFFLQIPHALMQEYQKLLSLSKHLILALPKEAEAGWWMTIDKFVKKNKVIEKLKNLSDAFNEFEELLNHRLFSVLLDSPKIWTEMIHLLANEVDKNFYFHLLSYGFNDQAIEKTFRALPQKEGRIFAIAIKCFEIKSKSLHKTDILQLNYTENYKQRFKIPAEVKNTSDSMHLVLQKVAKFFDSPGITVANAFSVIASSCKVLELIKKLIHENLFKQLEGIPECNDFLVKTNSKKIVFRLIDALLEALIGMPKNHFSYRQKLIKSIVKEIEQLEETLQKIALPSLNSETLVIPSDVFSAGSSIDCSKKIYHQMLIPFLQNMLVNISQIKSKKNKR